MSAAAELSSDVDVGHRPADVLLDLVADPVDQLVRELDLAGQLIEQLTHERFRADRYEDDYRQAVLALVDRKVAGEEVVATPSEAPQEQIIDLVAALKRSLASGDGKPGKAKPVKVGQRRKKAAS